MSEITTNDILRRIAEALESIAGAVNWPDDGGHEERIFHSPLVAIAHGHGYGGTDTDESSLMAISASVDGVISCLISVKEGLDCVKSSIDNANPR